MTKSRYEYKNGRDYQQLIDSDAGMMSYFNKFDIGRLQMMLNANRNLIIDIGEMLNKSQPPNLGKIEVRYWKSSKQGQFEPVIVVWGKGKVTKISHVRLAKRAKSSGGFARNAQETMALLQILAELFEHRKKLIGLIVSVKRSITIHERHGYADERKLRLHDTISDLEKRIDTNNTEALKRGINLE